MCQLKKVINKDVFIRVGVQGVQPPPTPPPSIFRFSLKSEGKKVEKKGKGIK